MRIGWLLLLGVPALSGELEKLAFLSGCWAGPGTYEMWMKPDGGSMMGAGRTVRNGKTVSSEYFLVQESKDGIVLQVQLKLAGQTTPFRATKITESSVTFENPQHDYPQRIIYRREGPESLIGRIEGVDKGKERAIDYPMKRARCD